MALFLQSSQFTHWSRDHVQKYKSEVYNGENEEFTSLVKQSMVKLHSLAKKFAFPENAPVAVKQDFNGGFLFSKDFFIGYCC
jgi:hypothetical protein